MCSAPEDRKFATETVSETLVLYQIPKRTCSGECIVKKSIAGKSSGE